MHDPKHVIRLANSCHPRTRLYAIPLEYRELADLSIPEIVDEARRPRTETGMAIPSESEQASHWMYQQQRDLNRLHAGIPRQTMKNAARKDCVADAVEHEAHQLRLLLEE